MLTYEEKFNKYVKYLYEQENDVKFSLIGSIASIFTLLVYFIRCTVIFIIQMFPLIVFFVITFSFMDITNIYMSDYLGNILSYFIGLVIGIGVCIFIAAIMKAYLSRFVDTDWADIVPNIPEFPELRFYNKTKYDDYFNRINNIGFNLDVLNYLEIDYLKLENTGNDNITHYIFNGQDVTSNFSDSLTVLETLNKIEDLLITF